jgi:hypothetical protein
MHRSTRIFILIFATVIITSLLSGCASTQTPQQYSKSLNAVLEKYNTWSTGILSVYHSMLASYTEYDPTLTYGDLIMGTIYSYQGGDGVSPSESWNPLDAEIFQGTVQMLYDDAREITSLLDAMTPPEEIAAAHAQLYRCVEYQANIAAVMLLLFTENRYEQLNYMTNPCDGVESALSQLTQFVQQHPFE